ncbi:MAG: multiheme c-type cytochrome [Byssovorax sp.]
MSHARLLIRSALLAALAGCASAPHEGDAGAGSPSPPIESTAKAQGPAPAAILPGPKRPLAPSEMAFDPDAHPTGSFLADLDTCEGCHADAAAGWRTSAHAFSSFSNPIYRVSVDRFRAEVSPSQSRHCGGCHDIALMADGAMDHPIEASDKRAYAGVNCRTCHGIEETRADGNGSYTLTGRPIPLPKEGDAESLKQHIARVTPAPLRTAALCGTCHKAFLDESTGNPHFFAGADDITPWQRSIYAGSQLARIDEPVAAAECRTCHMPKEPAPLGDVSAKDGKIASHRFLGGHTWLASMRGDKEQLELFRARLRAALSLDIPVIKHGDGSRSLPAEGAPVVPGQELTFEVAIKNVGVGHRFPGGTLDSQDAWVEATVEDSHGRVLAEVGTEQEATGDDLGAHRLRALIAGQGGVPFLAREVNHFKAVVTNHTILPRDVELVELSFTPDAKLDPADLPLRIKARLRHRSRTLELQRAACAESKTARGKSFRGKTLLDPCPAQPVLDVAEAEVWIGTGWEKRASAPAQPLWKRLLDHAYGLQHAVQERLDEARPSLDRALVEASREGTPFDRARVLAALAWLEAHEGRTADALLRVDEAAAIVPDHPALTHLRGEALSLVWRWGEAVGPLQKAAEAAPRDDSAWTHLAIALGSRGGDDRATLDATAVGLRLQPRDPDLLRVQALGLRSLGHPDAEADAAYDTFRVADDVPGTRGACSAKVPNCALERNPVHVHRMRAVGERGREK